MGDGGCKNYYNKHNLHTRIEWRICGLKLSPNMSQNFCEHCEKLVLADWKKHMGNFLYEDISPFIISLGESDLESASKEDNDDSPFSSEII